MRPKVLFTASVARHFLLFHLPYLQYFQQLGYETHVACYGSERIPYVDKQWDIEFVRSPFSIKHISIYKQLKQIIDNEGYTLISCHTPMASVITRLASVKARRDRTKLIYTAHGFHFFNGAPLTNWLIFYPVEIMLSRLTDAIVCINNEDHERIKRVGSKKCRYFLINGIGVRPERFHVATAEEKLRARKEKNFPENDFILIYAAEFIKRKDQQAIILAVHEHIEKFEGITILFAGKGPMEERLKALVEAKGLDHIIRFIGYRTDMDELYRLSDMGISSSRQEGLPINVVEGMMSGLPMVVTKVRGHVELVKEGQNGFLFTPGDTRKFADSIYELKHDVEKYRDFSKRSHNISLEFQVSTSLRQMIAIYNEVL